MPNNPMNGMVTCDEGDDGILNYQDTCTTSCNTGFMVDGDTTRTCQSNMMFNGTEATCSRGMTVTALLVEWSLSFNSLSNDRNTEYIGGIKMTQNKAESNCFRKRHQSVAMTRLHVLKP